MSPTFHSKDGLCYPAKERIALRNNSKEAIVNPSATYSNFYGEVVQPGDQYIYEGPDRAAMFELFKSGEEYFGMDFHNDPDLIDRTRRLGYKSVTEYAKKMGWKKDKVEKEFKEKASVVTKHELPKKVEAIKVLAGGKDTAGQDNRYGGFGKQPDVA